MLPTQQFTPEFLLAVLRRRWWLLLVPLVVGTAGAAVYAQFQPDRFRSEAIVLVTPPTLPSNYVRPTVTLPLAERLRILQQEVLSRSRLERIILDFDLYKEERQDAIMEDIVNQMRTRDISVSAPRSSARRGPESASFVIGYSSESPAVAHRVAERLTSLFVDENSRQRENIAEGTDQFITSELQSTRVRLEETEARLEAYKKQFGGQLPEQMQSNVAVLQTLQMQVQSLNESINRDRLEQLSVERQIADLTGASSGQAGEPGEVVDSAPLVANPFEEPLAKARATLDGLLLRLTPDHPDVKRQERVVAELEERVANAQLRRPLSPGTATPMVTAADRSRANQLRELRGRYDNLTKQIENKQRQIEARQSKSAVYQARVDAAPAREGELISLMRDYETLKGRYNTLLSRSEEAKVAANMERRQVSEQFRIVEPPRVPQRPYSPDRARTTMFGAAAGAALGVLLIALLEYRDTTFRTDQEIVSVLALPVLAVVPTLFTREERRARWKKRWMLSTGAIATTLVIGAVVFWKFGL